MLEMESLLTPIAPQEPSGALLEYDPAFLALAEAARGKPEQRMGESVIPAEPPDWGKVERAAAALLGRTKDLRVAVLLVKARLHGGGLAGLFEGLALLRALLERHWDTLHPQLDAEDDGDPAMRNNALAELVDDEVIHAVRAAEVASARGVGKVRVRDLDPHGGNGAAAAGGEADEKPPSIDAVLAATDRAALARTAQGAAAAAVDVRSIEDFVKAKAGPTRGPALAKLAMVLQRIATVLGERVSAAGAQAGSAPAAGAGAGQVAGGVPGAIASRRDVLAALHAICAYYERNEPSSPIPLLMRRSERLVSMDFVEIIRDLMPESAAQAEGLRGKADASDSTSNEGGKTP